MRISDWSSDVCSSDLHDTHARKNAAAFRRMRKAEARNLERLHPRNIAAIEKDFSRRGARTATDGHKQRRLARTIGADQRNDFAFRHIEVDVVQHFDRSEEHTSELQSLMRISYAVFCL